tara:strand:+ start:252 stop:479 length:228 start_codon:yes stop_codon:yes gene_type:complete
MDDARKIKKVLGVLVHLSEHRGRNLVSGNLAKREFFHKKSEELKNILINDWNCIDDLASKFSDFQKSLDEDRNNL